MLLLGLFLGALVAAAPTPSSHVVHEKRAVSRRECHDGDSQRVDAYAILPLRIALTQSNLHQGYDLLMSVSDPHSPNYGKHWTVEEIHDYFSPSEESRSAVKAWLQSAGIRAEDILESTSKGWIGANLPAWELERLLAAEFYEQRDTEGNMDVGCDQYHVPTHLAEHIDFIKPGIGVNPLKKKAVHSLKDLPRDLVPRGLGEEQKRQVGLLANCDDAITPACLRALYGIPEARYNQPENALGVFEQQDTYDQRDLNLFFAKYAPNVPQGTHPKLLAINGAQAPVNVSLGGGESIVDFDITYSLLYPQTIVLYQNNIDHDQGKRWAKQVGGSRTNKAYEAQGRALFENLLQAVDGSYCTAADKADGADCGVYDLTRVLTVSYATGELFMPEAAAKRACNEYMKLGLKGHTIFFASGDYGPAGHFQIAYNTTNFCINRNKVDIAFTNGTVFVPQFPPSCPYITSVGATQLEHNRPVTAPERALHQDGLLPADPSVITFGSSGGFSNYFSVPDYQSSAIDAYYSAHDPGYKGYTYDGKDTVGVNGGIYAKGGRGIPDVSANGAHFALYLNGQVTPGGTYGTSLAAPIWASIITMINQERTNAGKGPVGFINPTLYKNVDAFTDITRGNAPGCGTEGFAAVPGWDPVTGLGTPNYAALLDVFMALP